MACPAGSSRRSPIPNVPQAPAIPTPSPTARDVARAPSRPGRERERLLDVAVVALPCAIAAVLAFFEITDRSLWLDEAASVAIAR